MENNIPQHIVRASDLIQDVWDNIDFRNMNAMRRMGIKAEMLGKIKALSRCYSNTQDFISALAGKFGSKLNNPESLRILNEENNDLLMEAYRDEAILVMLIIELKIQANKEAYQQFLDSEEAATGKKFKKEKQNINQIIKQAQESLL